MEKVNTNKVKNEPDEVKDEDEEFEQTPEVNKVSKPKTKKNEKRTT